MLRPSSLPEVQYNPYRLPPRRHWTIELETPIPRAVVGDFLENLSFCIREKEGAIFHYPDDEKNINTCRYEWNRKWRGDRFGLRIGMQITVSKDSIKQVDVYVTTKNLIYAESGEVPNFSSRLMKNIQKEVTILLENALNPPASLPQKEWRIIFYIETPPHLSFEENVEIPLKGVTFFKTYFVSKNLQRVSVVAIKAKSTTKSLAKMEATNDIMVIMALLTLASEAGKYKIAHMHWPQNYILNDVRTASGNIRHSSLYPSHTFQKIKEKTDASIVKRFKILWESFNNLKEKDKELFTSIILTYYSAVSTDINSSTLSVVALTAALSGLSVSAKSKCHGTLTCSSCGSLQWKHDAVSEIQAVINTIISTCGITEEERKKEIKKLVQRVYREQRSAFVHAAQLRHAEYQQGLSPMPSTPTNDAITGPVLQYKNDLIVFSRLTRKTLIEWLAKRAKISLDKEEMDITEKRMFSKGALHASISVSSRCITRIG